MGLHVSVIVPVYNSLSELAECLSALTRSANSDTEIIVVDDASTDDPSSVTNGFGVRLLRLTRNSGPGGARNHGARHARGEVLFFVDADVVVAPDALRRVVQAFDADPKLAAVFGSYDARPRAAGVVSQYRNLLHHFVHQHASPEASTFWAGCGAIRRNVFEAVGGFDTERFRRPSIEDIDLGFRVRRAGHRIVLDKQLQGTHLKRWGLRTVIWTDITRRAIPWSRLILETKQMPNDLNVSRGQRLSVGLVGLSCLVLPLAALRLELLALAASMLLVVVFLNRELFTFFLRQRGLVFALACLPLHLLYFLNSGLSFLYVWLTLHVRGSAPRASAVSGPIG